MTLDQIIKNSAEVGYVNLDLLDTEGYVIVPKEEIRQLRAALKPFADMAKEIEIEHPGWYHQHFTFTNPQIKMTWLIDARHAHG